MRVFFWQPLRSKNTLSVSIQIPITCKPGCTQAIWREQRGESPPLWAAEMIQGYGKCFGSCGCLCPFVKASLALHQLGLSTAIKLVEGKKWLAKAELLSVLRKWTQRPWWGRGRFEPIPLSSAMLWLVWPTSAPSLLLHRPEMFLAEPLHALPFPSKTAFAWFYGDLSPLCPAGLAMARKQVLNSQHRARNVKMGGLTSGCFSQACPKPRCLSVLSGRIFIPLQWGCQATWLGNWTCRRIILWHV